MLVRSCFPRKKEEDAEGSDEEDGVVVGEENLQASVGTKKQRKAAKKAKRRAESDELGESSSSEAISSGAVTPVGSSAKSAPRGPTVMAGGRRRKGMPRKAPARKPKEQDAPTENML